MKTNNKALVKVSAVLLLKRHNVLLRFFADAEVNLFHFRALVALYMLV